MEVTDADPKNKDKIKSKYVARTPVDLQRIKVQKLMEHPEKPVVIPMSNKQKNFMAAIPTFVRNVMGSSAGAGSGEFHVYRHLRRKEYARQKHIQHKSRQEELDDEYQQRLENNRINSESKTAKKRAKRQKKKMNAKNKPKVTTTGGELAAEDDDSDDVEEDQDDEETAEKMAKSSEQRDVVVEEDVETALTVDATEVVEELVNKSIHPMEKPASDSKTMEAETDSADVIAGCAEKTVIPANPGVIGETSESIC